MKTIEITVTGDVQGVSYRYFAKNKAKELGLSGWAKNQLDGTVHIVIQGETEKIDEFVEWTKEGSPMAEVKKVDVIDRSEETALEGFEVK